MKQQTQKSKQEKKDCCEECFKRSEQSGQYEWPCNNIDCACHLTTTTILNRLREKCPYLNNYGVHPKICSYCDKNKFSEFIKNIESQAHTI